jgi:hypothetical protein
MKSLGARPPRRRGDRTECLGWLRRAARAGLLTSHAEGRHGVRGAMRWPRLEAEFDPGREPPTGHRGQIMKMLTSVDPFVPPKRARNSKEWFERAKLVVATARDRAVEMAQQREAPSMTRPPTWLQRHRLAERLSAKSSRGKRRTGRLWVRKGRLA